MSDRAPEPAPSLLPLPEASASQSPSLWREAPGWRYLVLAAIGLSTAFVSLPFALTPPAANAILKSEQAQVCNLDPGPFLGPYPNQTKQGQVVGFLREDQAMRLLQTTQANTRMAINPDYVNNLRALVHVDGSLEGSKFVVLVPQGLSVRPGSRIEFVGGHADPALPCHYVPNLIDRLL